MIQWSKIWITQLSINGSFFEQNYDASNSHLTT